jgi:fumarate reductase subunit C
METKLEQIDFLKTPEEPVLLQKVLTKSRRTELFIEIAELVSGLLLVGFLWAHMFFVATVLVSPEIFNRVPEFLEATYLAQIGIPSIILLILAHMVLAGRRLPARLEEQRILWKHLRMLGHMDTWTWLFQAVSGFAIGILAAAHIWTVVSRWTINMEISAERVRQSPYFIFYIILLLLGEYHAGIGLYRPVIKWGWIHRKNIKYVLNVITIVIIALGLFALFAIKGYEAVAAGGTF